MVRDDMPDGFAELLQDLQIAMFKRRDAAIAKQVAEAALERARAAYADAESEVARTEIVLKYALMGEPLPPEFGEHR